MNKKTNNIIVYREEEIYETNRLFRTFLTQNRFVADRDGCFVVLIFFFKV